jgi:uncharacterized protein YbjT (DUF2867 family)
MFVITGITGQVGGVVARTLLAQGREVRAVVRSADKGAPWAAQGCEVALADMRDVAALGAACADAEAVFVLLPPNFDPAPGFAQTRALIDAVHAALTAARPRKVVCLSTVGAQASQANLLTQLQVMEQVLGTLPMPVAFLRAGWFIENAQWDVEAARATGVIPSFLQPLDKPVPMVATADIGRLAAEMLQQDWLGTRVVELEGPHRVSPNQLAASFARVLGREVRMPRDTWEALFTRQGMQNPTPRMQMLDGFNEGWIEFAAGEAGSRKGVVALDTVVRTLVERSAA